MLLSRGDPWIFFQRPLSLIFLAMAALLLVLVLLPMVRQSREAAFQED